MGARCPASGPSRSTPSSGTSTGTSSWSARSRRPSCRRPPRRGAGRGREHLGPRSQWIAHDRRSKVRICVPALCPPRHCTTASAGGVSPPELRPAPKRFGAGQVGMAGGGSATPDWTRSGSEDSAFAYRRGAGPLPGECVRERGLQWSPTKLRSKRSTRCGKLCSGTCRFLAVAGNQVQLPSLSV